MFSTIKGWMYAAGTAMVVVLVAIFQYRGAKIDTLEEDLEIAEGNAAVVEQVMENERKVTTYETQNQVEAVLAEQPKDYGEEHAEDPVGKFYSI